MPACLCVCVRLRRASISQLSTCDCRACAPQYWEDLASGSTLDAMFNVAGFPNSPAFRGHATAGVVGLVPRMRENYTSTLVERLTGYFVPPYTGDYSFYLGYGVSLVSGLCTGAPTLCCRCHRLRAALTTRVTSSFPRMRRRFVPAVVAERSDAPMLTRWCAAAGVCHSDRLRCYLHDAGLRLLEGHRKAALGPRVADRRPSLLLPHAPHAGAWTRPRARRSSNPQPAR